MFEWKRPHAYKVKFKNADPKREPGLRTKTLLGTVTTDYGLRLDARFSLAETLGRLHNEWRENAKF